MITIVDYGMGNVGSILNMCHRLRIEAEISGDPEKIARADRLILPGVGAFDEGCEQLRRRALLPALQQAVIDRGSPVLGICLGFQLMTRKSHEGSARGLAWLDAETVRLAPSPDIRVPHMGWNRLAVRRPHPLLSELPDDHRFYFAHSYHVVCHDEEDQIADARHDQVFTAVAARGKIVGTQFHPEKSHRFGMLLFRNFAERM
jgi:glutamine amidotransferase